MNKKEKLKIECSFETNDSKVIFNNLDIQFQDIKVFKENILIQENNIILNNEPIDVVISYANITYINLKKMELSRVVKKILKTENCGILLEVSFKIFLGSEKYS